MADQLCNCLDNECHSSLPPGWKCRKQAPTSNPCITCDGTGRIGIPGGPCYICQGTGRLVDFKEAPLRDRVVVACMAGCSCPGLGTKTPDPQYHNSICRYRVLMECLQLLDGLPDKTSAEPTDAALLELASQYDQGPGSTYEFDQETLLRLLRDVPGRNWRGLLETCVRGWQHGNDTAGPMIAAARALGMQPLEPSRNQANAASTSAESRSSMPRGALPNSLGTGGAGSHPAASSSYKASGDDIGSFCAKHPAARYVRRYGCPSCANGSPSYTLPPEKARASHEPSDCPLERNGRKCDICREREAGKAIDECDHYWHTDGYCVKCETTRPLKASGELTHKAGDVCQVCGGIWQSVSNVGGVAHVCPGSPLNGDG